MRKYLKLFVVFAIVSFALLITGCKTGNGKDNKCSVEFIVENRIVLQKEVDKNYVLSSNDFPTTPTK